MIQANKEDELLMVKPGDILRLAERDYCYGIGPLVVLVTRVVETLQLVEGEWLCLWGVPVMSDGTQGKECYFWASLAALRAQAM